MTDLNERDRIRNHVSAQLRSEVLWTKLWSVAHHGFLFGAAILSGAAALLLQLKTSIPDTARTDWAAALAAAASLMGVLAAVGGFQRKWRTNRMTKSALEELQIDLMSDDYDVDQVKQRLKYTIRKHHLGIIGESDATE